MTEQAKYDLRIKTPNSTSRQQGTMGLEQYRIVSKVLADGDKGPTFDQYQEFCEKLQNSTPATFSTKCLACGDQHPGGGSLPCPKYVPTSTTEVAQALGMRIDCGHCPNITDGCFDTCQRPGEQP